MSNATDFAESALGSALFLGQPMPTVSEWHVGLFTQPPDETGQGGVEVETLDTGYQRTVLSVGDGWEKSVSQDDNQTVFYNQIAVQFNSATLPWDTVTHFGLYDPSGNLWIVAPLTVSKAVNIGDAPVFLAGELQILFG
jgi:hypothetical protein